jgi:hypothetical protein
METFSDVPGVSQPDWGRVLPRDAFYEIMRVLRRGLPRPETDDAASWARRDRAAMAGVASLQPANAAEARMAAQFVVADAYSLDCFRVAQERWQEPDVARRCAAQGLSMLRESKCAMRVLMRMQAARRLVAADDAEWGRAEWAEHAAASLMAEALVDRTPEPEPEPEPEASPDEPAAAEPAEAASGVWKSGVWKSGPGSSPATSLAEASFETMPGLRPAEVVSGGGG